MVKYFWPEIETKGISSKEDMRTITEEKLRETFIHFIINPYNRTNSDKIPESLRNLEENHKTHALSNNEWDDEKESNFQNMAKDAYSSVMKSDLDGLVDEYLMGVTWLKDLFSKDFPSFYFEDEDKEEEILKKITVEDFKEPRKVKEFIGESQELGETDLSGAQQDIIDNRRSMTQKEFFDSKAFNDNIRVNYDKANNLIEVGFTVDHSNGSIGKKIINEAWPSAKIALESDLGSEHLTSPKLGYKYEKEREGITSAAKDKGKGYKESSTNVWYKEGKEPQKIDAISQKKVDKYGFDPQNPTKYWEEDVYTDEKTGKEIVDTTKVKNPKAGEPIDTEPQKTEIDNLAGNWRETLRRKAEKKFPLTRIKGRTKDHKDTFKDDNKVKREKYFKHLLRENEDDFKEQLPKYRGEHQEAGNVTVDKLDIENSIKINATEMKLLTKSLGWFDKATKLETPQNVRELFVKLMKKDSFYKLIKDKIDLSPQYFRKFTFTFKIKSPKLLEEHGLDDGYLWMPLDIKIEAKNKVSMSHLYKVSKPHFRGKLPKHYAYKPKTGGKKKQSERASSAEAIVLDSKSGFNEARNHLSTLIQSGIKRLERAAPYLIGE